MKGLKLLLGLLPTASISTLVTTYVVSCGLEDNMVQIFSIDNSTGKPWTNYERAGITTLDKTKVERYSLESSNDLTMCKIVFYFKDGTTDNTQNKWWQGNKEQYIKYFKEILNIDYIEE